MLTIRQKIVNELKSEVNWKTFEVGVFSRGVPTNQFQVLFTSCIDICLSCYLQVGTRCHLFTSWYTLSFVYKYTLSFVYKYTLSLCYHLFTRVYNVLQVHVSPRSDVAFGNDVALRNTSSAAKSGSKFILYTTTIVNEHIHANSFITPSPIE